MKGKSNVVVITSTGMSWATQRGARRLVDRGLAERMADGGIRMREEDPRFNCQTASIAGPDLEVVEREIPPACQPHGFARYPIDPEETLERWRRAA